MLSGMSVVVPDATWAGPPDAELFEGMVGRSGAIRTLFSQIRAIDMRSIRVLITGETGTGKRLLARAIFRRWSDDGRAVVMVTCGAPQGDRELADRAHDRPLFLDDVSELSYSAQQQLLQRLSTSTSLVVASTTRSLEPRVQAGLFDAELYRRLARAQFAMPALRQRREDILPLARFFAEECSVTCETPRRRFTREADRILLSHDWPGNVRELRTVVLTASMRGHGPALDVLDFRGLLPSAEKRTSDTYLQAVPIAS